MRKIRSTFIQPTDSGWVEVLIGYVICIEYGRVVALRPWDSTTDSDAEDMSELVVLPGFIDPHVHLSQWDIRGSFEPALLPWLQKHVFPAEARFTDPEWAEAIARRFFHALLANGSTTAVVYTAPYKTACDSAFEIAKETGIRVFMGMTLMDSNSPQDLLQTTDSAFHDSRALFQKWDRATDRLRYIFTPRFAPTCTMDLMTRIGTFARDNDAWIQSHLSENKDELRWVQDIFGMASYTSVYQQAGILGPRTLMAHAIHISNAEIDILRDSDTRIVHCPDSNFFLKSGEFPFDQVTSAGIKTGIASDVGAGSTLNMLCHAKMANYRQSKIPLTPQYLLWNVTLGNAAVLDLEDKIGSLHPGKDADLCILKVPGDWSKDETLPSKLVFCFGETSVVETVIGGDTVYKP
jgi:guanine deaminase